MNANPSLKKSAVMLLALTCGTLFFSACKPTAEESDATDAIADPRHPRVIFVEQPAVSAIISWTTRHEASVNRVFFDTQPHGEKAAAYRHSAEASRNGQITLNEHDLQEGVPGAFYHHAQLNNLTPSTRYYVLIESDGAYIEPFYFITAPNDGRPFKLISGGDSRLDGPHPRYAGRTPHTERKEINRRIRDLVEEHPDIIAFAHGADWGDTADWRHLYWWFEDNEIIRTEDNRLLPFIVSRGNHDMQIGFEENFWLGDLPMAQHSGYYYTTQLNGSAALISLNTEISVSGDQKDWLQQELKTTRSSNTWVLAQYHRPAWPAVKEFDRADFVRIRQNWPPLFEEHNIDLVLESDGHSLKRTVPIRDGKFAEDGIVYIGEGGLGVAQRNPDTTRWFLQEPGFTMSAHHVWLLEFDAETLRFTAIGIDGEKLDSSSVNRRQ